MKRGLALAAAGLCAAQSPLPVHAPSTPPGGAPAGRSADPASPASTVVLGTPLSLERRLRVALARLQHPGTALVESYVAEPGLDPAFLAYLQVARPAFTYDNALAATAWLACGDLARARGVLDRLVALQAPDGSLAAAFHVVTRGPAAPSGTVDPTGPSRPRS